MDLSHEFTGPILILDDVRDGAMHIAALVLARDRASPPAIECQGTHHGFEPLAAFKNFTVWRARFVVSASKASHYHWHGTDYHLASDLSGDVQLAYASCNGEEHGDLHRDPAERNVMWRRLGEMHKETPFAMLLHGGDQIYADEVTDGHALTENWPLEVPQSASVDELQSLKQHLREGFAERYAVIYSHPGFAWLSARVPSLMQWDDHDICDGWGSLPETATESAVGEAIFVQARQAALLFQHGCTEEDVPSRFADPEEKHLGWQITAPGFRILAPDLRSQRGLTKVMDDTGWAFLAKAADDAAPGHTLLMSSVPLLGPRLSVIEWLMRHIPGIQKYEDDLRDQWQSRAHRDAWIRMLTLMREIANKEGAQVTAISGEIHLASRAEMELGGGKTLHQLVASGITHRPPPKAWALALGGLAAFGEDPLPEAPIRIHPLPGQRNRYTAERNALVISRIDGDWSAYWTLENSGPTPPLALNGNERTR